MAVLARAIAAAIALAGCYAPSVRDCTVTCAGAGECAAGQVCGTDGFCAAPAVAGTCGARPDGGAGADADRPDATRAVDARAAADAHPDAGVPMLEIEISGRGRVTLAPSMPPFQCESPDASGTTCELAVVPGLPINLGAMTTHKGDQFQGWSGACNGGSMMCMLVAANGLTVVGAQFEEGN